MGFDIEFRFQLRFPICNIKKALFGLNKHFNKKFITLKDFLDFMKNQLTVQDDLYYIISSKNFDFIVIGEYAGTSVRQEEFFKIVSKYTRDFKLIISREDNCIFEWLNKDGKFSIKYISEYSDKIENYYDEGIENSFNISSEERDEMIKLIGLFKY